MAMPAIHSATLLQIAGALKGQGGSVSVPERRIPRPAFSASSSTVSDSHRMIPVRRSTCLALALALSAAPLPAFAQALQNHRHGDDRGPCGEGRAAGGDTGADRRSETPRRVQARGLRPRSRRAARVIVVAPDGALYVSDRDAGTVTRIDATGRGQAPSRPEEAGCARARHP